MPTKEEVDALNAALASEQDAKAVRDEAHAFEVKKRAVAMLKVERELTESQGGTVGEAFALVDGGAEGPIGIRLGENVLHKRFMAAIEKTITPEACDQFVRPCVIYPDKATFAVLAEKRPGLLYDCANALMKIYGRNEASERSK
jgi:hypothetical protein